MLNDLGKGAFRLRPGLAVMAMEGAVQLRAGDEEIHVVETDAPEMVERLLQRLAQGSPREAVLKAVGEEHGELLDAVIEQLAARGVLRIIGLNFRDEADDALAWLDHFGNPYTMNIQDYDGRTSIDFGVYAAPESFLVDEKGTIVFKQLGALTPEVIETEILPRIGK